jgi:hypothetical protein
VLIKHHGRVGDAAKALGIQRTNLYRKVRQRMWRDRCWRRGDDQTYQIGDDRRGK